MDLITIVIALSAGLAAVALGYVILNPNIHEGITIKVGLLSMVSGFGSAAATVVADIESWESLLHAVAVISVGALITIAGVLQRIYAGEKRGRRRSDVQARRADSSQDDRRAA